MKFEKWQALGNDYVIVEAAALPFELSEARIRRICDPHFGIGSDGVLLLSAIDDPVQVAELRIFNPDGSEAELSGNGAREAVMYLRRAGWTEADTFSILTKAGPITPTILSSRECAMEIGRARTTSNDYPSGSPDGRGEVESGGRMWAFRHISIGNPQCAIEVDAELEELDLQAIGPAIEHSELFPDRTNVSFFRLEADTERGGELDPTGAASSRIRARIFERGVGETLASGTGASGAAVAAFLGGLASPITVDLDGGELLVEINEELGVRLTGTAEPVFAGELSAEAVRALAELR